MQTPHLQRFSLIVGLTGLLNGLQLAPVRAAAGGTNAFLTGWCGAQRNTSQAQKNVGHSYDSYKRSKFRFPIFLFHLTHMKIHSILNAG
jgi:hypothetical protein